MSDLTKEYIEGIKKSWRNDEMDSLCDMALRTLEAEKERDELASQVMKMRDALNGDKDWLGKWVTPDNVKIQNLFVRTQQKNLEASALPILPAEQRLREKEKL